MNIKTNRVDQVCVDLINDGIESKVKNDVILLDIDLPMQKMITFLSDYRAGIVRININTSTIHLDFPEL